MEHPEEPAAEPEPEGVAGLRDEREAGVVQGEPLQFPAELLEIPAVQRVHPAEHHLLGGFITGQRLGGGPVRERHRVADGDVLQLLDPGEDVAHLTRAEGVALLHAGGELADLDHVVIAAAAHEAEFIALFDRPLADADVGEYAAERVVFTVEHEAPQGGVGRTGGGGDPLDDRGQHGVDVLARLRTDLQRVVRVEAQHVLDLFQHVVHAGDGQVDLVHDGDDLEVLLDRRVGVGHRLGLHPLEGVDQQERPLAGGQAAGDLVVEVDVPGRVDQVQFVGVPVGVPVAQRDGAGLDGDAPLLLDVQVVEQLLVELPLGDRPGLEQQLVGQRALAVVDVGHDGEVPYELRVHRGGNLRVRSGGADTTRAAGDGRRPGGDAASYRRAGRRSRRRPSPPRGDG